MSTHPLFEDLTSGQLVEARAWLDLRGAESGSVIVREGDAEPLAIAVIDGEVETSRGGFFVDRFKAGEVVHPDVVFGDSPAELTVTVSVSARLVFIDRVGYAALREQEHPLALRLERQALNTLAQRLHDVNGQVGRLTGDTSFMEERTPPPRVLGAILDRVLDLTPGEPVDEGLDAPADVLARCGLFPGADPALLELLGARMRQVECRRGSFLATQGERSEVMIVLARGSMEVVVADEEHDRIHELGRMGPGSVLGIAAMVGDCPARASCLAAEDTEALVLDRWAFESLMRAETREASLFRGAILRLVAKQLAQARATLRAHRLRPRRVELLRAGVCVDVARQTRLAS